MASALIVLLFAGTAFSEGGQTPQQQQLADSLKMQAIREQRFEDCIAPSSQVAAPSALYIEGLCYVFGSDTPAVFNKGSPADCLRAGLGKIVRSARLGHADAIFMLAFFKVGALPVFPDCTFTFLSAALPGYVSALGSLVCSGRWDCQQRQH
jgi:hypothetical protein